MIFFIFRFIRVVRTAKDSNSAGKSYKLIYLLVPLLQSIQQILESTNHRTVLSIFSLVCVFHNNLFYYFVYPYSNPCANLSSTTLLASHQPFNL